jgi:hypothetical protein
MPQTYFKSSKPEKAEPKIPPIDDFSQIIMKYRNAEKYAGDKNMTYYAHYIKKWLHISLKPLPRAGQKNF